jgi:hypothetical protein
MRKHITLVPQIDFAAWCDEYIVRKLKNGILVDKKTVKWKYMRLDRSGRLINAGPNGAIIDNTENEFVYLPDGTCLEEIAVQLHDWSKKYRAIDLLELSALSELEQGAWRLIVTELEELLSKPDIFDFVLNRVASLPAPDGSEFEFDVKNSSLPAIVRYFYLMVIDSELQERINRVHTIMQQVFFCVDIDGTDALLVERGLLHRGVLASLTTGRPIENDETLYLELSDQAEIEMNLLSEL